MFHQHEGNTRLVPRLAAKLARRMEKAKTEFVLTLIVLEGKTDVANVCKVNSWLLFVGYTPLQTDVIWELIWLSFSCSVNCSWIKHFMCFKRMIYFNDTIGYLKYYCAYNTV